MCKGSEQVLACISKEQDKHSSRTFIVQKYIYPFLFHRRKFDIRCFVLVTATPQVTAYYYPEGYIRTSSFQFNPKNLTNRLIHLTNDAVQKKNNSYSKYEEGNKIRFEEFQVYLDNFEPARQLSFRKMIVPRMKELAELSIRSARNFGGTHSEHTF